MTKSITHYFCLDIGGTGTRGALFDSSGRELGRAEGPAGALSLGARRSFGAIETVWGKIIEHPLCDIDKTHVKICAGIAGIGLPSESEDLTKYLSAFGETVLVGDGYGALIGATHGQPGALISIGTGIGALSIGPEGKTQAASSWGFPAGDAGSGAWIGLRLFADFLKAIDAIALQPPVNINIIESILEITGRAPTQIMHWQMNAKPKDFAALAPLVVSGAAQKDPYCLHLLEEAAQKILRVAMVLVDISSPHVYLSGGLGATLLPYCNALAPEIDWQLNQTDPINGIYLIATGAAKTQESLPRMGLS